MPLMIQSRVASMAIVQAGKQLLMYGRIELSLRHDCAYTLSTYLVIDCVSLEAVVSLLRPSILLKALRLACE